MLFERWIKNWQSALYENFFLRSTIILLSAGLILNATVFRENTRVIVVPPTLTEEFWIEKGKASPEYLEQMGVFIATLAGNLSPRNAEYNIEQLLKYIEPSRVSEVKDDLKAQALYIKKNNISQTYYADSASVDIARQVVTIEGQVTRNIGTIKVSEEKMRIHIGIKIKEYSFKVTDLFVEYPDRKEKQKADDVMMALPPENAKKLATEKNTPPEKKK
ncbi:MAG TPA: type IV conjugative transfer system protein TraE [Candidatus Hydrogenedentes bacterium]|nr:type IV conjugative transfer system protein TraE [Candidatus Hydrogenedentota bacterium]